MRYEKSCGAVVYTGEKNIRRFLIIRHDNGGHWGFPKGHVEEGENEKETALREIYEETGLRVDLADGFRDTMEYSPLEGVMKEVVYFIALSRDTRVLCQEGEVLEYKWLEYKEALETLTHENSRELLRKAEEFLINNEI